MFPVLTNTPTAATGTIGTIGTRPGTRRREHGATTFLPCGVPVRSGTCEVRYLT